MPCAQEQAKPRESFIIIFAKRQKQAKPATRLQIGKVDEFCLYTFSPCPCFARFGCSSFEPRSNGAKVSARGEPRQQRCRKPRKPPRQQRLRSPLGVERQDVGGSQGLWPGLESILSKGSGSCLVGWGEGRRYEPRDFTGVIHWDSIGSLASSIPIGSMVLVYMLTLRVYWW